MSNIRKVWSVVRSLSVREVVREIDYAASLDNRFGHKMLAVVYGILIFQIGLSVYLSV
jgi:hypothetical protein